MQPTSLEPNGKNKLNGLNGLLENSMNGWKLHLKIRELHLNKQLEGLDEMLKSTMKRLELNSEKTMNGMNKLLNKLSKG